MGEETAEEKPRGSREDRGAPLRLSRVSELALLGL
jgi:hypothetical protein